MIAVVADDLTGSVELARVALSFGLKPRIMREPPVNVENVDVLVLDTDSRSRSESEAIKRVRVFATTLKTCGVSQVYKKTDSVLRGHVRAEIDALLDVMAYDSARLVPANPKFGRVIRGGNYYINGVPLDETTFADDPEFPATTSSVDELLGFSARIGIPDAESNETLDELARFHEGVMPAGGADYFCSWLKATGHDLKECRFAPCSDIRLAICGSSSTNSRIWVDARVNEGIPVVGMPDRVFSGSDKIDEWTDDVKRKLVENELVIVAIRQPLIPDALEMHRHCNCVAALTARVVPDMRGGLAVEGGATASAVFHRLGWKTFEVVSEWAPGVVQLREAAGRTVLFKSGSPAWPDRFFRERGNGGNEGKSYLYLTASD